MLMVKQDCATGETVSSGDSVMCLMVEPSCASGETGLVELSW